MAGGQEAVHPTFPQQVRCRGLCSALLGFPVCLQQVVRRNHQNCPFPHGFSFPEGWEAYVHVIVSDTHSRTAWSLEPDSHHHISAHVFCSTVTIFRGQGQRRGIWRHFYEKPPKMQLKCLRCWELADRGGMAHPSSWILRCSIAEYKRFPKLTHMQAVL